MNVNYVNEKEITQVVNAVIDPKNIVSINTDNISTTVIVQNMDEKLRSSSERQLSELLSPLVPRTYGIWVHLQKDPQV